MPLDLVEIQITDNKRKKSEENNKSNTEIRQTPQVIEKLSTLQTLHNGTNAPHLSHVPLVELPIPEEEPYERIPAECFTMSFDCKTSPSHMCCAYHS